VIKKVFKNHTGE
jgi:hypothetical protein